MKRILLWTLVAVFFLYCGPFKIKKMTRETVVMEPETTDFDLLYAEVKKNPTDPQARLQLGRCYVRLDKPEEALAQFDTALALNPELAEALIEKGYLLCQQGQLDQGYSLYLKALQGKNGEAFVTEIGSRFGQPYPIFPLTQDSSNNAYPCCSPKGDRIAFQSDREGNWDIFSVKTDGSDLQRLTWDPAYDESPVYAPNGKVIAFTSTRDDTIHTQREELVRDIYFVDVEGQTAIRITKNDVDDWYPAFSPEGDHLIFVSEIDDFREVPYHRKLSDIYSLDLKNDQIVRLTQNEADDGSPSLAFNHRGWIVFTSNRDVYFQIYRMDQQGGGVQQLTFEQANHGAPHYSPDGQWLTFFSDLNGNYDIYRADAEGGNPIRLTNDPAQDAYPVYSPDGNRIYFHSNRSGTFQIYWIDLKHPFSKKELIKELESKIASLAQE